MSTNITVADLMFVKNDDPGLRSDPVWQEFVEHILSVGSAEQIHFHLKGITDKGSEAFKELRDREIDRYLQNKANYERLSSKDETDSVCTVTSDKKGSRSRKARRGTADSYGSRRSTLFVPSTRRNTRDASPNNTSTRRNTTQSMNKRRESEIPANGDSPSRNNIRDQAPLNKSRGSQDKSPIPKSSGALRDVSPSGLSIQMEETDIDDTLNTDACSSRRSSISGSTTRSRRNSIDSTHSAASTRRGTNTTNTYSNTYSRKGTVNSDSTGNTDSRRSTNTKMNEEGLKQLITNTVIEEPEPESEVPNSQEKEYDTSASSQGWRAVRRDIEVIPQEEDEDKHLEKLREEDPGGWNLISNTSGYLTDAQRARKTLYEKYLHGHSPWYEGLRTYHHYKLAGMKIFKGTDRWVPLYDVSQSNAIEERAQHQRRLSRITVYKRARAMSPPKPRPATVSTLQLRQPANQNADSADKTRRRPSTCPPFRSRSAARKNEKPGETSSYREKPAVAEFRNVTPLRPRTAFTRS